MKVKIKSKRVCVCLTLRHVFLSTEVRTVPQWGPNGCVLLPSPAQASPKLRTVRVPPGRADQVLLALLKEFLARKCENCSSDL